MGLCGVATWYEILNGRKAVDVMKRCPHCNSSNIYPVELKPDDVVITARFVCLNCGCEITEGVLKETT